MDTDTIGITELTTEQLDLVAGWLSDPATNRWLNSEWRGKEASPRLVAMAMRNPRIRMYVVNFGSTPCGLIALYDIDEADRTASLWYFLGEKQFANQGVITTALQQLSTLAFSELGLASLSGWIMADNLASRKVLEKAGFKPAGCLRKSACSEGRLVDRLWFDQTKDDAR